MKRGILFVTGYRIEEYYGFGSVKRIMRFAKALSNRNIPVYVVSLGSHLKELDGITVIGDSSVVRFLSLIRLVRKVSRLIVQGRIALVQIVNTRPFCLIFFLLGKALRKRTILQYDDIVSIDGKSMRLMAILQRFAETTVPKHADMTIATSRNLETLLPARKVEKRRVLLVHTLPDTKSFNPDVSGAEVRARLGLANAKVLGYAGTFYPDVEQLFMALRRIRERVPRAYLLLMGRHMSSAKGLLINAIERLELKGSVIFVGPLLESELPIYLAACDVLVLPGEKNLWNSLREPVKLYDYMAMGKPVVASNIWSTSFSESDVCFTEPTGMAQAILKTLDDTSFAEGLGRRARRRILLFQADTERQLESYVARVMRLSVV